MKRHVPIAVLAATVLAVASGVADEALVSGPQPGKNIPGAFSPLNCTGSKAGQKNCLV